jgi:hypothetical protein
MEGNIREIFSLYGKNDKQAGGIKGLGILLFLKIQVKRGWISGIKSSI